MLYDYDRLSEEYENIINQWKSEYAKEKETGEIYDEDKYNFQYIKHNSAKSFTHQYLAPKSCLKHYRFGNFIGGGFESQVFDILDNKNENSMMAEVPKEPKVVKVYILRNPIAEQLFELNANLSKRMGQVGVGPRVFNSWICNAPVLHIADPYNVRDDDPFGNIDNSNDNNIPINEIDSRVTKGSWVDDNDVLHKWIDKYTDPNSYKKIEYPVYGDPAGFLVMEKLNNTIPKWYRANKNDRLKVKEVLNKVIQKLNMIYKITRSLPFDISINNNIMMNGDEPYFIDFNVGHFVDKDDINQKYYSIIKEFEDYFEIKESSTAGSG